MSTKIKNLVIKELPLTIIVAMKESDNSILIASDSEAMEERGIRINNELKLFCHSQANIAWGSSGNISIGIQRFTPWLESYDMTNVSWEKLRDMSIRKLSELNNEQRDLVKLSGATPRDNDIAICLLVGWLDKPEIFELNDRGMITSYWRGGFQAIGTGKPHAWIVYKALKQVSGITILDKLRIIMETTVTTSPECGKPFFIWRITKDDIVEGLESGEENAKSKRKTTDTTN